MRHKFDKEELQRGFDILRENTADAEKDLATDRSGWEIVYREHLRENVASYLSIIIRERYSEPDGAWPSSVMMGLMLPSMRKSQQDLPFLPWGYELMDLYDAAVTDGKWTAFNQRLDEFERYLNED